MQSAAQEGARAGSGDGTLLLQQVNGGASSELELRDVPKVLSDASLIIILCNFIVFVTTVYERKIYVFFIYKNLPRL